MIDAVVDRLRAERSERGHRAGAGGLQGRGVRGERHHRRRRAVGRADAAGLRRTTSARPSIRSRSRRRSCGRCRSPRTGWSGSSRRRCSRIRSTMAAPSWWSDRSRRPRRRSGATATRIRQTVGSGRRRLAAARARGARAVRLFRGIPSRSRGSGCDALRSAEGLAAARVHGRTDARAVRRHRRARHAAARPPADRRRRPRRWARWPRRRLADSPRRRAEHHRRAGRLSANRSAARSSPTRRSPPSTSCRPRGSCCAICRRGRCSRIAGHRFPQRYRRSSSGIATAWACSRWTGRSTAPIPWTAEACRRAGTVHLGGTLTEIARSETATWDGATSRAAVRAAQSADAVRSVARAGAASTSRGAYCHVPGGIDRRHARPHRAADRALRAGIPRLRAGAIGHDARRHRSAQREPRRRRHRVPASSTCGSSSRGRRGATTRRR